MKKTIKSNSKQTYRKKRNVKLKVMKHTILSIVFCLVLSACDRIGHYNYILKNETDKEFYVTVVFADSMIRKVSKPNTFTLIHSVSTNSGLNDYKEKFIHRFYDTLYLSCNDSIIIKKNILDRNNWQYTTADRINLQNNYLFVLTKSDIESN